LRRASTHQPTRSCVGCNQRDAQHHLARVTLVDGKPVWDRSRSLPGRGAYLHLERRCFDGFLVRKPFVRSLRASLPATERRRLVDEISLS
jgi:predicted RNA-binding protein YlxR (DUF448 family)